MKVQQQSKTKKPYSHIAAASFSLSRKRKGSNTKTLLFVFQKHAAISECGSNSNAIIMIWIYLSAPRLMNLDPEWMSLKRLLFCDREHVRQT